MDYVVGFLREALSDRVLMVRKAKPAWQAGLLNGVGGKVDKQVPVLSATLAQAAANVTGAPVESFTGTTRLETPVEAMVWELREVTRIETKPQEWRLVLYMADPRDLYTGDEGGTVYWFAATRRFLPKLPPRVLDSGEDLLTVRIPDLGSHTDVLASPKWVIPMAFGDPTLDVLGSDADVRANGKAATVKPTFRAIDYIVGKASAAHRRAGKIAAGVLKPNPRFERRHSQEGPDVGGLIKATAELPSSAQGGFVHHWNLKNAGRADKPPVVASPKRVLDDAVESTPVGCKLKFVHRWDAKLCGCADLCMGVGMSPDNLALARGELAGDLSSDTKNRIFARVMADNGASPDMIRAVTGVIAKPVKGDEPPHMIVVGDYVVNKNGTERGKVLFVDDDSAWVQSSAYPAKRVTMYLADLRMDPCAKPAVDHKINPAGATVSVGDGKGHFRDVIQVESFGGNGDPTPTPIVNGDRLVDVAEVGNHRRGWVSVNGETREHNGRALGNRLDPRRPPLDWGRASGGGTHGEGGVASAVPPGMSSDLRHLAGGLPRMQEQGR